MNYLWISLGCVLSVGTIILVHLAIIEVGREVVTVRTASADGSWKEMRLWVVDYGGNPWLHSKGEAWEKRFAQGAVVEMVRNGETRRYRAIPDRSLHAELDRELRRKYGLADRWVRFLVPCDESVLPVRLLAQPAT